MPAEAIRLRRRVTPRDLVFLGVITVGVAATLVAFQAGQSQTVPGGAGATCVGTIRAYTMGGATFWSCDAGAASPTAGTGTP